MSPGEFERVLGTLVPAAGDDLLIWVHTGHDAAVVRIDGGRAIVLTGKGPCSISQATARR